MPLDRLVLIVVCVIAAFMATLWLSVLLLTAASVPFGFLGLIPAALVAYIMYRVIRERVGNETEDHYDGMDH